MYILNENRTEIVINKPQVFLRMEQKRNIMIGNVFLFANMFNTLSYRLQFDIFACRTIIIHIIYASYCLIMFLINLQLLNIAAGIAFLKYQSFEHNFKQQSLYHFVVHLFLESSYTQTSLSNFTIRVKLHHLQKKPLTNLFKT